MSDYPHSIIQANTLNKKERITDVSKDGRHFAVVVTRELTNVKYSNGIKQVKSK
jgi:hypothetical protein